jgi:hypothetical protein
MEKPETDDRALPGPRLTFPGQLSGQYCFAAVSAARNAVFRRNTRMCCCTQGAVMSATYLFSLPARTLAPQRPEASRTMETRAEWRILILTAPKERPQTGVPLAAHSDNFFEKLRASGFSMIAV